MHELVAARARRLVLKPSSMSRSLVRKLRLAKLPRPPAPHVPRTFHTTSSPHFVAALDAPVALPEAPTTSASPWEKLKRRKLEDLEHAVAQERANPARVWGCYIDVLTVVDPGQLPLEMHQRVLRKCTLPPAAARADLYRRIEAKRRPRTPHIHEVRFQAIIRNMREAGYAPTAEDYEVVLEQFAAVGHHVGALQVMQEMTRYQLPKTHKTYGLCLLALAHRLTLPYWHADKGKLLDTMTRTCLKLTDEMWKNRIPVTQFNVDLSLRILKETMDLEGFQKLLRVAYGIDLAYPDRPPLEFWDKLPADTSSAGSDLANPPIQQPFSTSALNSTLDFLGRTGNISKLIQAFEVLTTPLPPQAVANPESAYADDEDEDFGINNPAVAPYTPPYAEPNTTSFQILIKWLSRAGRPSLARHYLIHAMETDRIVDRRLRGECMLKRKGEIQSPHLGITHYMFLPILGEANRDKNMELLRFVLRKIRRALRRKRFDIAFYTEIQKKWREQEALEAAAISDDVSETPSDAVATTSSSLDSSQNVTRRSSSAPIKQIPFEPIPEAERTPAVARIKLFDVDAHLAILRRDQTQIEQLEQRAVDILGRNTQRVKERLGRRIWGHQDVYLRSTGRRTRLTRDVWRDVVQFKPTRAVPDSEDDMSVRPRWPRAAPGHIAAQRGFFTPSSSVDRLRGEA